jgi:hypothetical protein
MKREVMSLALRVAVPLTLLAVAPTHAATKISQFGYTITTPGTYQVTTDLSGSGNAITTNASNVDLSLNGHTLSGDGSGLGIYVPGQSNVSIHHRTVQSFGRGIVFQGTLNGSASHLTVRQNPDLGIDAEGNASGISVTDNILTQDGQAIQLALGARACTVARNTTYQRGAVGPGALARPGGHSRLHSPAPRQSRDDDRRCQDAGRRLLRARLAQ